MKDFRLWTPEMMCLLQEISNNGLSGIALMELNQEDKSDFLDYLEEEHIDFATVLSAERAMETNDGDVWFIPEPTITVYGDSRIFDDAFDGLDAVVKESYGYSIKRNSKYIAKALYDYAENNLILIEDKNLIKELWVNFGLPIPLTNTPLENNNAPVLIEFSKPSLIFKNQNGVYQMRRAKDKNETTQSIEMVKALLCEELNKISEDELLQRTSKKKGLSSRELEKVVNYVNNKIKPLFGESKDGNLDYKLFLYDPRSKTAFLNPELKDRIKKVDEVF